MGIKRAIIDAAGGTFADQWKDIITAGAFDELTAVVPGVSKTKDNNRGNNTRGSSNVISNGSKIYVPENTAAFIFSQSGIEEIIGQPGGYEYTNGQPSVFNGDGLFRSIFKQTKDRFGYGGITPDEKRIAFVNLREIRGIKFGTHGPLSYNDIYYGTDLEITAYGSFTIKIIAPEVFIRNYVPANSDSYSFKDMEARSQITEEFLQSFVTALSELSKEHRLTQLLSHLSAISDAVSKDANNAGTWGERFGFSIVGVAVEAIQYTDASRELVRKYAENKMSIDAYSNVSPQASNIAAQQKIAEGIHDHGLGNAGGMVFGMNLAQGLGSNAEAKSSMDIDKQIETLKKLKELADTGILTEAEFEQKKKEILGI